MRNTQRSTITAGGATVQDLYIGGTWRAAADGGLREIHCPADGILVGEYAEGTAQDSLDAIAAARAAFDSGEWPNTSERDRAALLFRLASIIERDKAAFARAESLDTGKRLVEAEYDMDDVMA